MEECQLLSDLEEASYLDFFQSDCNPGDRMENAKKSEPGYECDLLSSVGGK